MGEAAYLLLVAAVAIVLVLYLFPQKGD